MQDEAITVHHIGRSQARTAMWRQLMAITALFVVCQVAMVAWIATTSTSPVSFAPTALLCIVYFLFLRRAATRGARRLATYQLTLGPNVLRIVHANLVPTEVFRHDVRRIIEYSSAIRIEHGAGRFIGIPRAVDGYDDVRARLAAWHPIERGRATSGALLLVAFAAACFAQLSGSRAVVIACDLLTMAGLGIVAWRVSRSAGTVRVKASFYVGCAAFLVWTLWTLQRVLP
jgi:hypothetical protein